MATGITRRRALLVIPALGLTACAGFGERRALVQAAAPTLVAPSPTFAPTATPVPATPTPDSDMRLFPQTGHSLRGAFRRYWETNGGAAVYGLPLTEALWIDGALTQYFERARFELRDGTVQPAQVGAEALEAQAGGRFLRATSAIPAPRTALVIGQTVGVRPLGEATIHLQVAGYTGPAEVVIADRNGVTGRYLVQVKAGDAEARVAALGTLGSQAAIVQIDGQVAGVATSALMLRAETMLRTGQARFDELLPTVKGFMEQGVSRYVFDGSRVRGYRSPDSDLLWLRDHVHQGKGYAYWERDMTSLLDQFRRFQYPDGSFDDYIANKSWGLVRGRTAVEADLEYLFIEGVYRAWQATGDDAWLRDQIEAMERGLAYIRTSPLRWDEQHQLVKRPFTVDTWDFEYGPPTVGPDGRPSPRHWIDEQTKWSIFHGDNTGYANSMELLARMLDHLGAGERAEYWRNESAGITERLHALAWNGDFFQHMVHLTPVEVPGVDEARQLSLSNAYALNRAGMTFNKARAIIDEYYQRYQARGETFSEWFSIDPPFPTGSLSTGPGWGREAGEYVNGGRMPLVGGELARGAFRHGAEAYGFDILQRYHSLVSGTGGSYLWYHPDGRPGVSGPDTLNTDGWGSSAMLAALIEGATGVQDEAVRFQQVTLAPRWAIAGDVERAEAVVRYGASDGYVAYDWRQLPDGVDLRWTGAGANTTLRILLPTGVRETLRATVDGQPTVGAIEKIGGSRYWVTLAGGSGTLAVRW